MTRARARATRWRCPPESSCWRREPAGKSHHRKRVADPPVVLGAVQAEPAQAVADVLGHAQVREDGVALEDHVGRAAVRGHARDRLAGDGDGDGAFRQVVEVGEHAQERGLAAAGGAEEGEELAGADRDGDLVQGGEVAEPLGGPADVDEGSGGLGGRNRYRRRRARGRVDVHGARSAVTPR
jgi:hypothetical protein